MNYIAVRLATSKCQGFGIRGLSRGAFEVQIPRAAVSLPACISVFFLNRRGAEPSNLEPWALHP